MMKRFEKFLQELVLSDIHGFEHFFSSLDFDTVHTSLCELCIRVYVKGVSDRTCKISIKELVIIMPCIEDISRTHVSPTSLRCIAKKR